VQRVRKEVAERAAKAIESRASGEGEFANELKLGGDGRGGGEMEDGSRDRA
jgi:hypothetical protein